MCAKPCCYLEVHYEEILALMDIISSIQYTLVLSSAQIRKYVATKRLGTDASCPYRAYKTDTGFRNK
jgi:hypothetical protein